MAIRTADPTDAPPDVWDLSYASDSPCSCGELGQRWHSESRTFFWVPCENGFGGQVVSWPCKMAHHHKEVALGRDPVGKGGRPFRVSASEGWTQYGAMKENTDAAKREGKDLQLTSRT